MHLLKRMFHDLSVKDHAAIYMSLAMAVHFFGYEFGRSGALTLFTSPVNGFQSSAAYSVALTCVSPLSFLLVMWYGRILDNHGSREALRRTSLTCALVIFICGILVYVFRHSGNNIIPHKVVIWIIFVFQHSYSQLLYTQYWSFLGSIMSTSQGVSYFSLIAGLSSISSTVAAASVSRIVKQIDLVGLLVLSSISLLAATFLGDFAYNTIEKHTFDPAEERMKKYKIKSGKPDVIKYSFVSKAFALFQRTPVLVLLFLEVISFRTLCSILNLYFIKKLRADLSDDSDRAAWTGKLYSMINGVSAFLQFIVLPVLMKNVPSKWLWRIIPMIPMISIIIQSLQCDPSLLLVSVCLFSTKCIDYSTRKVANEIIYVSLDFDGRYFGKEIIGVFGDKLGGSIIALILSILTYFVGETTNKQLTVLVSISSFWWGICAYRLSSLVPEHTICGETEKKMT